MTDLQVRYQTLQETKRANEVLEGLKTREQDRLERFEKVEIDKLRAEIDKINAQTSLTNEQKQAATADVVGKWISNVVNLLDPFGFISSISSGFGKGIGKGATELAMADL